MKLIFSKLSFVLFFCLISYNKVSSQANIDSLFDMSLESIMNLEVKTAGKKIEKASEIPASVVIVSRDEIKRYGYRKLEDILRHITGLYLVEQYCWNGVTGFGVRGYATEGSFSNIVIMINGNNIIREGYIDQYVLSRIAVPVEAIERIEVIRGPMAVMYGSGAFFGAINIITFYDKNEDSQTIFTTKYGSFNDFSLFAGATKKNDDFHFSFNIGMSSSDGLDIPYTKLTSNWVDTTGKTVLEKFGLKNDVSSAGHLSNLNNNIRLVCKYSDFLFEIGYVNAKKGIIWQAPAFSDEGQNVSISGTDFNIQYEKQLNEDFSINTKLFYNNYKSYSKYNILKSNFFGYSDIKSSNISYEMNLFYHPNNNLNVLLAYQWDELTTASNSVDIPDFNQINSTWKLKDGDEYVKHYLYSQIQYHIVNELEIILGARIMQPGSFTFQRVYNQGTDNLVEYNAEYDHYHLHIDSRLGIVYNFLNTHYLKLLLGTAGTEPNLRQNTTRLENIIKYNLGDINALQLSPSKIITYEIVYEALLIDWFSYRFSLFNNNLNNIIESSGARDSAGTYVVITQNSGEINTNGLEFQLSFTPLRNLELSFSGSYQQSKNMKKGFENIDLGYSPNWLLYSKVSWLFNEDITLAMNAVYVDFMKASWNQRDISPEIGTRYGKEVKPYVLIDANIRYENIITEGSFVGIHLSNILNSEIRFPTDPSNTWADKGFLDYGFRFFIDLGYQF